MERLEAHFQNRIYYFHITSIEDETITISMYKTPYIFLKHGKVWKNSVANKMQMAEGLIEAVILAIENADAGLASSS